MSHRRATLFHSLRILPSLAYSTAGRKTTLRGKGQVAGPPAAGSRWLLAPEGQVAQLTGTGSSSDSVEHHKPWLLAPKRQVWSPTVVAGTPQVSALAYILTGEFCVNTELKQLFSTLAFGWSHHLGIQHLQSPYCVPVSARDTLSLHVSTDNTSPISQIRKHDLL